MNITHQKGLISIFMTIAMVFLLGMVGLAVDTGFAFAKLRQAQIAADSAAIAGAFEKHLGHSATEINNYALSEAASHDFEHGTDGVTVTVNNPPANSFYVGESDFVEVVIDHQVSTFFLQFIGFDEFNYTVRAVANSILSSSSGACVYSLGESNEKAFHVSSNSELIANCGVHANSSNSKGLYVDSGSEIDAAAVETAGGAYESGSTITPSATEYVDTISDPYDSYVPPTVAHGTCDYKGNSKGGGLYERYEIDSKTKTLDPGNYCGGIFIKGTAKVTLNPGTYILQGGGLVVDGDEAKLTGDGVHIYNTCAKKSCDEYGSSYSEEEFHPLDVKSSGTLNLSSCSQASSSACQSSVDSNHEDFTWYTDTDAPETSKPQQDPVNKINSSASADLAGIFHMGHQYFEISSNSGVIATNGIFVTKYIQVASSSNLSITHDSDAPSSGGTSTYARITLVE